MTTDRATTDAWPKLVVLATGSPLQPGRFFAIQTAATASIFVVSFILYRMGIPFLFAFALTTALIFIKAKALHWMEPQRISTRSRPDGAILVQGKFSERTLQRDAEAPIETVGTLPDGGLSIVLVGNAQPVTLDTANFRPERLQALEQLFDAMLRRDMPAIESVADRHGLKSRGRNGNTVFILWEKPNAAALNVGALALAIALLMALREMAS